MTRLYTLLTSILFIAFSACTSNNEKAISPVEPDQFIVVLGNVQDAGYPHIGCARKCCSDARKYGRTGFVSSLGLVDKTTGSRWLFDATPDIGDQLHALNNWKDDKSEIINGVFLTHAHIGHYTGLMYFGREALGSKQINVHVMPGMDSFLRNNGPWDQLIGLGNIELHMLSAERSEYLGNGLTVEPVMVPHRDEYSETIGFLIASENKKLLFIPDIDKWSRWDKDLVQLVKTRELDYLLIDGTFYENGEILNRDMSEIPHPFITETMDLLHDLTFDQKQKIYFIHFNHTNPVLDIGSEARKTIVKNGFNIADEGLVLSMD